MWGGWTGFLQQYIVFITQIHTHTLSSFTHSLTQHRKASRSPHSQVELATSSNTFPSPLTVIQSHCSAEWTLLHATGSSSSMTCVSTTSWRPWRTRSLMWTVRKCSSSGVTATRPQWRLSSRRVKRRRASEGMAQPPITNKFIIIIDIPMNYL